MSYISQTYTLTVQVKNEISWNSDDTDYVSARLESLKYELEKIIGDKFDITFNEE